MNTIRILRSLLAAMAIFAAAPAEAQRVRFGTMDTVDAATPVPSTAIPGGAAYQAPGDGQPITIPPAATAPGTIVLPPGAPATLPPGYPANPAVTPPPGPVTTAPPGTLFVQPGATFNGTIQAPPAGWDAYGQPGAAQPGTIFAQDPYIPGTIGTPSDYIARMQRLLQEVRLDYRWYAGHGSNAKELGINDVELTAKFAVPLFSLKQPFLITPGFAVHYWDGPQSNPPNPADMPPQTFDAYIDAAWNPVLTPSGEVGAELSARVGYYSDFKKFDQDAIRISGKGMAVIGATPSFQVKAGVWYINRVRYKLLPAGGIVWKPNQDVQFDILFPNPMYKRLWVDTGTTRWWWYVRGEYGGGTWSIVRANVPGSTVGGALDLVDYNDIEVALGVEFNRMAGPLGVKGLFEVGGAFDRELFYRGKHPQSFNPNETVFLRAGLWY